MDTQKTIFFLLQRLARRGYYLVVLLLQLGGLLLVWLLVLCSFAVPHLTQFLGRVSNCESGILTLHFGAEFSTEQKECRPVGKQHIGNFIP